MKQVNLLFGCLLFIKLLTAQSTTGSTYFFNGNLNENSGGPALTQTFSCSATAGTFGTETITTSTGTCGTAPANTFRFNDGGGVQYSNTTNFVRQSYTINVFFKFNAIGGYSRIIDFSNSTSDNGIYLLGNCLNFYPSGNIGPSCSFQANKFYLLTLSRDSTSKAITVYVDGVLYTTYNDASNYYISPNGNTPVIFFRDDNAVPCETEAGSIKYLSIQGQPSTSTQVAAVYSNICNIVLPVTLTRFTGGLQGSKAVLNWATASELNSSYFVVQHSSDGNDFVEVGRVAATNSSGLEANYSFTHVQLNKDNNYYRLKQVDKDGNFTYSAIITLKLIGNPLLSVFPNPTKGRIVISGITTEGVITISTIHGKILLNQKATASTITLNIESWHPGTYILQYHDGNNKQVQKIIRQ